MKKSNHKPVLFYIMSFLVPAVIICAALAGLKITPFGDNSLVLSDGNALYINYLGYVGRAIKGQEDLIFSFEKGLGSNMMGSWGWFLLNPFFVLFSFADITSYMTVYTYVSMLNFCICGLTMYFLLKDIYGHRLSNLSFSTAYALNGFMVANVFQMNFFTGVHALPLMVLGLRKIFKNRNPILYILSLTYSLLTNFYFGFMLCVASLLVFLVLFFLYGKKMENKKYVAVEYIISSLIASAMSSFVWLPAIFSLRGGRLDQSIAYAISFKENMPFLEMFSKLFTGANSTSELRNGLPNIFVGILPVFLVILFFMSNRIPRQKKTAAAILLGVYLISFYISVFNIAMHGGTVTNWFNYRDSFVFSFIMLLIAAEEWRYIADEPSDNIKRSAVILIIGTLIVFSKSYEYVTGGEILLDFAILILMFLAFWMHRKDPGKNPKHIFEAVVLVLVCLNLFLNYDFSTKKIMEWSNKESEYQKVVMPVGALVEAVGNSDKDFYRMEIGEQRSGTCGNDPMLYGYNGVGHGGSDDRDFVRNALSKLGVHRFNMRNYYGKGITGATDTLLGLKYIISKEDLVEEKGYERLVDIGEWILYRNPYALRLAVISNRELEAVEMDLSNVFENLNKTWTSMTGNKAPIFIEEKEISFSSYNTIDPATINYKDAAEIVASRDAAAETSENDRSEAGNSPTESVSESGEESPDYAGEGTLKEKPENMNFIMFTWTASHDGPVYTYNASGMTEDNGSVMPSLNYEGYHRKGDTITGYLPVVGNLATQYLLEEVAGRFRVAYVDMDALAEQSRIINSRSASIVKDTDRHLTGTFAATDGQELIFTIPYDEGWTLTVDGQEAELKKVLGVFMAAEVSPGTHTYEMIFMPVGLKAGIIVAVTSVLLLTVFLIADSKYQRKKKQESIQVAAGEDSSISQ